MLGIMIPVENFCACSVGSTKYNVVNKEPSHNCRDYFLVHKDELWHFVGGIAVEKVTVSEDRAQTVYLIGLVSQNTSKTLITHHRP